MFFIRPLRAWWNILRPTGFGSPRTPSGIETSDLIPVSVLVNIAREAGASSLLLLTVDRPVTKWVKIETEVYDLSGALLWKESVDEGGGLSGKGGVKKALDKLRKRLDSRLGQPGLEQLPAPEATAAPAPLAP